MQKSIEKPFLRLFYNLLRIRRIEEQIANKYHEQKMRCPVHLSIGQEAIAVGVCDNLSSEDLLFSNHRAHAHYLAKGGNLPRMIAEIYGKKSGCCLGRGGSMHLIDIEQGIMGTIPIVGGIIPVGVGACFGKSLQDQKVITTVFMGEGSTEEGVWAECLNFISLYQLPVLFICENNLYSVYSPLNVRQSKKRDRLAIAKAHGIETNYANGNDIEQVHEITKKAISFIKNNNQPYFLEFSTYRYREHCGPNFDDDLGYRNTEEIDEWKEKCPLALYTEKLMKQGELNKDILIEMEKNIENEIEAAFLFAESSPFSDEKATEELMYKKG
jgi:pyruvate dehydrogenase E1 component alpha subunit